MPPAIKNFLDLKKIPLGYLFALYITWIDPLHGILQPFRCSSCERGNKSLPEPMLTQFCVNLWWNYELINSSISLHTLHLGHQIDWILAPMYPLRGRNPVHWTKYSVTFFCFAPANCTAPAIKNFLDLKKIPLGYLFALYITWMDPLHGILQPFGCSSCEREKNILYSKYSNNIIATSFRQ